MAKDYTVNYKINVNSDSAIAAIHKFQEATETLEKLTRRFSRISQVAGKTTAALRALGQTNATVNVKTDNAEKNLREVIVLLDTIKTKVQSTSGLSLGSGIGKLSGAQKEKFKKDISDLQASLNSINNNKITPKASVTTAEQELQKLIDKLKTIKEMSNISINAKVNSNNTAEENKNSQSSTAAAAAGGASTGRQRQQQQRRQQARRQQVTQAGHSRYLFPSTRQVLGPTYAGSGSTVGSEMLKGIGTAYGLSALFSGVTQVYKDATDYNNVSQTTKNILATHDLRGNFDERFDHMNQLMRQVGVETKFTAPQVAEAGKFLAMAGLNIEQIENAIRPIADIALIGDTELGETADVVTNIMTGYEIPSKLMGKAADILTMTFTKTNTTLMELAESFKYAGTIAKQAGVSFETSSAAFGVLGNAGIKGSHAGTTLRMMINNMLNPNEKQAEAWKEIGVSTKDSNGNLRNFVDIMSDLNEKSKFMSNGEFTSLIARMFRITSLPGALALIKNSENIKDIVDKNYDSTDLSSKLASEKKNTIQGLWYQMTSAFTETGMKGFEQMHGVIKGFLIRMTNLMKSSEFAVALKDTMNIMLKIIDFMSSIIRSFANVWSMVPNYMKDALVLFLKIQIVSSTIASLLKSIISVGLLVRGVLLGQWINKIAAPYLFIKNLIYLYSRYRGHGIGILASTQGAFKQSVFGQGVGGAIGGAAGGAATGASSVGLLKYIKSPYAMAAVALLSIGAYLYKTYERTQDCIRANIEWAESYRNLGVDKMELNTFDDVIIANMRIYNNELSSHTEKINQSAKAWERYWDKKNGPKKQIEDQSKFVDTVEGSGYKELFNKAGSFIGVHESFESLANELGASFGTKMETIYRGVSTPKGYMMLNGQYIDLGVGASINENGAIQLLLSRIGSDKNNKEIIELEKHLATTIPSAVSHADVINIINNARNKFLPKYGSWDERFDKITSDAAENMTLEDVKSSQAYMRAVRINMENVFKQWEDYVSIIKDVDSNGNITPTRLQTILEKRYGWLFDPRNGLFGSAEWVENVKAKLNTMPSNKVTGLITETFDSLLGFYELVATKYKPLFAPFLNRSVFEQLLPDAGKTKLSEGGFYGGKEEGDKMTSNGVEYTWKLSYPTGRYAWIDSNGKIFMPGKNGINNQYGINNGIGTEDSIHSGIEESLHSGRDESEYKDHYQNGSSAPKQIIVKIDSLMRVDNQNIDMNDSKQVAAINNIKQELATALLEVVQDFNNNMI